MIDKRKYLKKRFYVLLLLAAVFTCLIQPQKVLADSGNLYIALGADLTEEEKQEVLNLLGLSEEDLQNNQVLTVTNEEEHEVLDGYISDSVIGSRALSSVVVRPAEEGQGIHVTTQNISYCTAEMYESALATAGVTDADITVAGPFTLSGTAALVGTLKAYSSMTGTPLQPENIETATEELVTTGEIGEAIGSQEKAEELIGAIKEAVVSENISSDEDIQKVIEKVAGEMNITLTQSEIDQLISLMKKILDLNIDPDQLEIQLKGLYERLDNIDLTPDDLKLDIDQNNGILGKMFRFLGKLWDGLGELLNP